MKPMNRAPIWCDANQLLLLIEKALGYPYQFLYRLIKNTMKTYPITHLLASLFLAVFLVSASQGQTCNPNIPLKTPDNEFIDHGDGTVTHQRTGLIWKQCPEGLHGPDCDQGTVTDMTWSEALVHASSHEFASHSNWRLPNIKELASIAETACYASAINLSIFPNDQGWFAWSSSPDTNNSDFAWSFSFYYGYDNVRDKGNDGYVRLVRDGQ